MMKRVEKYFILVLFLFFFGITRVWAINDAQTLGDLRSNYRSLVADQQKNNNQTAEAKAEIARKEAAVKQAEADIHKAEEEMQAAQVAIDESNEKISQLTKEAEKLLLYLQQIRGENAYIEYVSGASTMTDLVTRIAAIEQLTNHIQTTMGNLEVEIKKNEDLKAELTAKKTKLEAQSIEYKKIISANYAKVDEYNKYALDIDTQVKVAKTQLDSYEKKCLENAGRSDDAVLLTECSRVPLNSGWLKPLNYGIIMSEVGSRWGSYHNALDISGNSPFEGTQVFAAAAGEVAGIVPRHSCGGNMVFINVTVNGKKYVTYYFHLLTYYVKVGDIVDQNTVIGLVGGYSTSTSHGGYDGCTTGAHLHFGVANGFFTGYSPGPSTTIVPPGFPNQYGWRFYSRTQMY